MPVSPGILRGLGWRLVAEIRGQPIGPIAKSHACQLIVHGWKGQVSALTMGPIRRPETSITTHQLTLRKIPEERRPHI
jgi:hypothetical protein